MGERALKFSERLFFMMVWVIIVLILAGFLLHLASANGILPGVAQWIGERTNLQAQVGG